MTLHAGNPTRWGAEKQYLVRSWIPGYVPQSDKSPKAHPEIWLDAVRMAPVVFPGADVAAFLGFAANGESLGANTTNRVQDKVTGEWKKPPQLFHEAGLYGCEMGPADGPAPSTDPKATGRDGKVQPNAWLLLHDSPDVVALLGHPASMLPDAWKKLCADQTAVGLVNIRRQGRGVFARYPSLKPSIEGSLWGTAIAFMAWSAGTGRVIEHMRPFVELLAAVDEASRWGMLLHFVARAGVTGKKNDKHKIPAYSCARTAQKIEAGRQLQEFMGPTRAAWYDLRIEHETAPLYEAIATLGYPS